jgi:heme exporter protein A
MLSLDEFSLIRVVSRLSNRITDHYDLFFKYCITPHLVTYVTEYCSDLCYIIGQGININGMPGKDCGEWLMEKPVVEIDVKDVTKKFGSRTLFSGISCRLASGDCLVVTGRNGSGKSTLVKILARLLRPTSGKVTFMNNGQMCRDWEETLPQIGFVSPEIVFYENLSGRENIDFLARARGFSLQPSQVEEVLGKVGLGSKGAQLVKSYSTGMKQRLKFSVLLAIDPPVWFIDEGLSNLDADGRGLILGLVGQAIESGHTLVMATNERVEGEYATQTIALS